MKHSVSSRHATLYLVIAFVLTFMVRLGVNGAQLSNYESDPDAYRAISQTLMDHGVYGLTDPQGNAWPTAFRPPLYPVLLSKLGVGAVGSEVTVAILHACLAALTSVFVFAGAFRLARLALPSGGTAKANVVATIATIFFVVDPILVQQSTQVMTETLAACLVMVTVWALSRAMENTRWIWVAAVALTLAYLCRPTFLVWGGFLVLGWCLTHRRKYCPEESLGRRLAPALVLGGVLAVTVFVWTMRNLRQFGAPVWATTHGGYTLLLGNNPMFYDYIRQSGFVAAAVTGKKWNADSFLAAHAKRFQGDPTTETFWQQDWNNPNLVVSMTQPKEDPPSPSREVFDDRLCGNAAKAVIRREPGMFVYSSLVRVVRLWSPLPRSLALAGDSGPAPPDRPAMLRYGVACYYMMFCLLVLVGIVGLGAHWREPLVWSTVSLAMTLTIVHAVYWTNLRMRAPAEPLLAIIAGYGVLVLVQSIGRHRAFPTSTV